MKTRARKIFLFFGNLVGVITACLGLQTQHSNHLGWALLFAGTAFTTIGSIYLGHLFLRPQRETQPCDNSLWLVGLGTLIMSLVTPLEYLFLPPVLPRSDHQQDIGLILSAGGLAFYLLSLRTDESRKTSFQPPAFRDSRSFATILRMVRSPVSASLILFGFGLGIGYSSLVAFLVIFALVLPGLIHWMHAADQGIHPIR